MGFPGGSVTKNPPATQEKQVYVREHNRGHGLKVEEIRAIFPSHWLQPLFLGANRRADGAEETGL